MNLNVVSITIYRQMALNEVFIALFIFCLFSSNFNAYFVRLTLLARGTYFLYLSSFLTCPFLKNSV